MRNKSYLWKLAVITLVCLIFSAGRSLAVTSKVVRHSSGEDLLKGETKDVVVGSKGTLQLGRAAEVLVKEFEGAGGSEGAKKGAQEPWSVNSMVISGEDIFIGTSPNGGIYKYSLGELTKIYPLESEEQEDEQESEEPNDVNDVYDANEVELEQHLSNEHIFSMATDISGRLLVGISGEVCKLCRLEAGQMKTVYEPNDAKYIFAIAVGTDGDIYLGTGPEGKVYRLDSLGKEAKVIYDSRDKNILSLAVGEDGFVYAGSDSRGLVYKIDPGAETATVLYDSEQEEITALLFGGGDLYATATSAKVLKAEVKFARRPSAGRPDSKSSRRSSAGEKKSGLELKVANTKKKADRKQPEKKAPPSKPRRPGRVSYVYEITEDGFVTDVFSESVVLFCLAEQEGDLLVGTGNEAKLFTIDVAEEEQAIIYEDEQASQITTVAVVGKDIYIGMANPAKLIKLSDGFAVKGAYTSDLIDAGQPAKWGKLQVEADIPQGCKVMVSSRSGNVKDVNDPTFSQWTESVEVTEPIQLLCPLGRFCQYRLVLRSKTGQESPLLREVAVAHTVPNLAPKVKSVSIDRLEAPDKAGIFKISHKAKDDNGDKLIYKIEFRKTGRTGWIELEDEIEKNKFEWDGRTVEDGRYEIKVTADDRRSNSTETKLTGSRISEPVVVDNTGPVIRDYSMTSGEKTVTLELKVFDELSAIGQVEYTVDSNAKWKATIPEDLVYDTTQEQFTIVIEDLEGGEHIVTVRLKDDVGNTTYKTFEVDIAGR